MIKNLVLFIALITAYQAMGGTCTSVTRSNYVSSTVLTASALNTDFNTIYNAANALDGGCVSDGTLEDGALNTTDFELLLNGPKQGCVVTATGDDVVSVDRCRIAVGNGFVKTTTATTATWGCSGCSAEVTSTKYYLYALATSSGSTLNLLISTTAPNADGYDTSNNRALAKFYNKASGAIDALSVTNWLVIDWENAEYPATSCTVTGTWIAATSYQCYVSRRGNIADFSIRASTSGTPTTATLTYTLPVEIDTARMVTMSGGTPRTPIPGGITLSGDSGNAGYPGFVLYNSTTTVVPSAHNAAGTYAASAVVTESVPFAFGNSDFVQSTFSVPVVGWD